MKKCPMCGVKKYVSEFNKNAQSKDELAFYCRDCSTKRHKNWVNANPDKMAKYEKDRKPRPEYSTDQYHSDGVRFKRHGLTLEAYNAILASQNNLCLICGNDLQAWTCIDHDHACCAGVFSCGKCVRGILCKKCNTALGGFKDDPIILRRAADYIEDFSKRLQDPITPSGLVGPSGI